ncbi:MAG: proteasome assembly chaperone family protein [Promethearchaeota archaeon]
MTNSVKKLEQPDCKGCEVPAKYSNIITEEDKIHFIEGKHPVLIIGFLGAGMVGNIIASEFIEQLGMEQIGFIVSEDLPAMAIFYDGVLKHPFRLYYSQKDNIIIAQCEVPFNKSSRYLDLARSLADWALKIGVEDVCCIQGLGIQGTPADSPVYVAAEQEIIDRLIKSSGVEILPKGLIFGPEAELLNVCLVNKLKGYALLTPVNPNVPAPDGAAAIIQKLNKIYNVNIDIQKLQESAHEIKEKLKELNQKTQQEHQKFLSEGTVPSKNLYL